MRRALTILILAGIPLLALDGCQYARQAAAYAEGNVDEAVAVKQRLSDVEARAAVSVPCVTTVGAFMRELTQREQLGVALICAPPDVTTADIERALGRDGVVE